MATLAQYDEVSERQVLWIANLEEVTSTSTYKDYTVANLFDFDNDTFWLSDFGNEINATSIKLGSHTTQISVFTPTESPFMSCLIGALIK